MTDVNSVRPTAGEYAAYYHGYILRVPDGDIVDLLERQIAETVTLLSPFTPEQARWRPAPGEWNALEIVGHLSDTERAFAYRAMCFARDVPKPLPGLDPDEFMVSASFAERTLADVVDEFVAVRRASIALLRGLDAAAWVRSGVADGNPVSVRALAYIMAGHVLHHAADFPKHRAMGS